MNIKVLFPKGGCLIFFGDIFGGRFHENYHQVINYEFDEMKKIFCIRFNEGETCTIYEPVDITCDQTAFVIQDATRITWEWYYYGREKTTENLNTWDFKKNGNLIISKTTTGNLKNGLTSFDRSNHPALQFL